MEKAQIMCEGAAAGGAALPSLPPSNVLALKGIKPSLTMEGGREGMLMEGEEAEVMY